MLNKISCDISNFLVNYIFPKSKKKKMKIKTKDIKTKQQMLNNLGIPYCFDDYYTKEGEKIEVYWYYNLKKKRHIILKIDSNSNVINIQKQSEGKSLKYYLFDCFPINLINFFEKSGNLHLLMVFVSLIITLADKIINQTEGLPMTLEEIEQKKKEINKMKMFKFFFLLIFEIIIIFNENFFNNKILNNPKTKNSRILFFYCFSLISIIITIILLRHYISNMIPKAGKNLDPLNYSTIDIISLIHGFILPNAILLISDLIFLFYLTIFILKSRIDLYILFLMYLLPVLIIYKEKILNFLGKITPYIELLKVNIPTTLNRIKVLLINLLNKIKVLLSNSFIKIKAFLPDNIKSIF